MMRSRNEMICKRVKYVAITAAHQNSPQCGNYMRWVVPCIWGSWLKWMVYIQVDNDYCWTQSFDFSGNEWKHDISFAPTQSTWEARPTQWLEQYSWQSVSFVKWSRFTINKLLWTFERRRYVFGHHSHGPHATMKLRFHEELKGNVRAQKHLLDTTAPN